MSAPPDFHGVDISSSFDGVYWGVVVASLLFGITIVQVWIYANTNMDKWPLQVIVAFLFLADFAGTVLTNMFLREYLVIHFGDFAHLTYLTPYIDIEYILAVMIIYTVQLSFARRVYMVLKGRRSAYWISGAIAFVASIGLAAGIFTITQQFKTRDIRQFASRTWRTSITICQVATGIADIIITVTLSWNLSHVNSQIKRTNTILQKLLLYVVSRGLLVTLVDFLYLILYLSLPDRLDGMPFYFAQTKLYVITMLVMLNGRKQLRNQFGSVVTDFELAGVSADSRNTGKPIVVSRTAMTEVEMGDDAKASAQFKSAGAVSYET